MSGPRGAHAVLHLLLLLLFLLPWLAWPRPLGASATILSTTPCHPSSLHSVCHLLAPALPKARRGRQGTDLLLARLSGRVHGEVHLGQLCARPAHGVVLGAPGLQGL